MYLAAAADFDQFSEILVSRSKHVGTLNELTKGNEDYHQDV